MLLTFDLGNTNVMVGGFEGQTPVFTARLYTSPLRTADEWAVLLRSTLDLYGVRADNIDGAAISSVSPAVTRPLADGAEMLCGHAPLIVGPGIKTGLDIVIDNPAQLGGDLVCGAIGALARAVPPIIIIDMGTATKLSALDARGRFIGCAISPGVRSSLESLSSTAALLPHIGLEPPPRVIGRNTVDSMNSGVVLGTASMLDGMVARMEREMGARCAVFATGGLAEAIYPHMDREVSYCPALLLEGLRLIWERNKK